ncbi:undecaprenyl/decaprenyl-phosphate alpha-N-acetylglucosaminyl 1-phosphate transferase [Patescibacteria group bacterium]|nr:undecaprenyl/decaprenyl-phosphate alpha-N-acetylglucosaminyl 1-phosphate transferase [Patescibacteria group bacterium]
MTNLLMGMLLAATVTALATPVVILIAKRIGIVDHPGGRRIHQKITPRLGGLAVLIGFFVALWLYLPSISPNFRPGQLLAFSLAALFLLVIGLIDDKWGVPPILQLVSHVVVACILVAVGMGIEQVGNPFGGVIDLHQWQVHVPGFPADRFLQLPADLLTIAWVVLVINAFNWLDGLDGLATGVGAISAATIALLSLSVAVDQPHVALLALILTGALVGFLPYNFNPAKIFLGTIGSTFIGFTLATLAIISGGKVATALLVLGFPIIDALSIVARRTASGEPPWRADTRHLHHLLLQRGYTVRKTVLSLYGVSAIFGGLALLAGTTGNKALAFILLAVLMTTVLVWLGRTKK